MIKIHEVIQGDDSWHKIREGLYTGSNAHKLLAHANKLKIVNGKSSAYALTEFTDFAGNFYTKRGHVLEDEAIELYEQITRVKVERPGFVTNSNFNSCGYSPDALRQDRTIECKAFKEDSHMSIYKGDIPLKILAQCHFGMLICGKKLCDLVIYNPSLEAKNAFKIIPIRWDPKIAKNFKRIFKSLEATT